MIDPETNLFIYEIKKDLAVNPPDRPNSMIGIWNEDDFSYVFFSSPQDEYVEQLCGGDQSLLSGRHEMKYRDWQEGLPQTGLTIAGVTFVCGSTPRTNGNAIFLDPSVVFGDGNHPTTISCIEFLVDIMNTGKVKSVLDLGCGSGILALASAQLGANKVVAVDKNRLAVQTTKNNISLNAFEQIIQIHEGEARVFLSDQYDLVLANLPFAVLRDVCVLKNAEANGLWVVSGINSEQADILKTLFMEQGFITTGEKITPPWVTFVAAQQKYWSGLFNETDS
ncbi:MAG: 50S ribosomal protein L11 methyltransferase [Desulfomonilaceae bacterium]